MANKIKVLYISVLVISKHLVDNLFLLSVVVIP